MCLLQLLCCLSFLLQLYLCLNALVSYQRLCASGKYHQFMTISTPFLPTVIFVSPFPYNLCSSFKLCSLKLIVGDLVLQATSTSNLTNHKRLELRPDPHSDDVSQSALTLLSKSRETFSTVLSLFEQNHDLCLRQAMFSDYNQITVHLSFLGFYQQTLLGQYIQSVDRPSYPLLR